MKLRIDDCLLAHDEMLAVARELEPYREHLREVVRHGGYSSDEASLNLPSDESLWDICRDLSRAKGGNSLRFILDVGIGGSNLGTKAVYDALWGSFDLLEAARAPKMIFADTNDPEFLVHLGRFLEKGVSTADEIVVNVISKSGGTTETVFNLELVWETLHRRFPGLGQRMVVTTDEGSRLWDVARAMGLASLPIPAKVGGRYSVFSPVGLFPLAACGCDVDGLRRGAREMRDRCLGSPPEEDPSLLSAVTIFLHLQKGRGTHDSFLFHPELESCGKWYRQLMGESVGKEVDLQGRTVNLGITPTVSIGSTDLHSMGQLYLGGPRDKLTTFIWAERLKEDVAIPQEPAFPGLVAGIAGRTAGQVMAAIREGTQAAYRQRGLPFLEVILRDLSAVSLGELFQFKMLEMMQLARLMNVNAFDQPNVESYKVETRRILNGA
jgi:glucose-6-phosphate isomerase